MERRNRYPEYPLPAEWRNKPAIKSLLPDLSVLTRRINYDLLNYENIYRDEKTNRMMREGKTIGCFYIESPGMRSLLRRLSVNTFEMLVAASSIIRPGVAESGMMQEFLLRHKDPHRRKSSFPEIDRVLSKTYGVMIYQEDVIRVVHEITGMSLVESDLLRRAMSGKMRSREAMQQISNNFFKTCKEEGLQGYLVQELWRQVETFAGYSFCKAHSASFAQLSYQVAFLKAHYPAEFMAGVLSNGGGFYSAAVYIEEAKRMGLKIQLPCINRSEYEYSGCEDTIRVGLMAIKNLSLNTIDRIVEERKKRGKYKNLRDFLIRSNTGFEESSTLIRCGAMDDLKRTRPSLLRQLDLYFFRKKVLAERENDLFIDELNYDEVDLPVDFPIEVKSQYEFEIFGYMVGRHPLFFFSNLTSAPSVISAADMHKYKGRNVKMVGWFMASKRIRTKKGEIMKFLSLEDLTGTFEAVIFPKLYAEVATKTSTLGPYIIEGRVDSQDENNLIVSKLNVVVSAEVLAREQKDSADYVYAGEREPPVTTEEVMKSLQKEKLFFAYAKAG
jgi:DNA polymerase III alpha subunit